MQVLAKEECREVITAFLAEGSPVVWSAGKLSISLIVLWREAIRWAGGAGGDRVEYWDDRSCRISWEGMQSGVER